MDSKNAQELVEKIMYNLNRAGHAGATKADQVFCLEVCKQMIMATAVKVERRIEPAPANAIPLHRAE